MSLRPHSVAVHPANESRLTQVLAIGVKEGRGGKSDQSRRPPYAPDYISYAFTDSTADLVMKLAHDKYKWNVRLSGHARENVKAYLTGDTISYPEWKINYVKKHVGRFLSQLAEYNIVRSFNAKLDTAYLKEYISSDIRNNMQIPVSGFVHKEHKQSR